MNDLREDLNAALDTLDVKDDELEPTPSSTETFDTSAEIEPSDQPSDQPSGQIPVEGKSKDKSEDKSDASNDSIKAPINWSPQQREEWSKVPRHLQEKIISREKEMDQAVAGTAAARKTHDYISNLAQTYAPVLAAEGVNNPVDAIEGLFKSVATLRMGSAPQKAQMMAQLVNQYGIDINMLDDALVGQQPQDAPNAQFEQMLEQKMAPINQVMQQLNAMQQQNQQQTRTSANQEVVEFAKTAEFLPDVRADMADMIDMAKKHGRDLTLQEAYDRACSVHPEISKVVEQRKQQQAIIGGNQTIAQKRAAAASLNGRQTGTGGSPGSGGSLRDQISAAWDDVASGL